MPRRNTNRPRTDGATAVDVRRRVTDHDDILSGDIDAELLSRAALRDGRQLTAALVIGAIGADLKAIRVDASGAQLCVRTGGQVAGEQTEHDVVAGFECIEQLAHAGHEMNTTHAR